ncbi:UNVERIFIED_CONTAM: hypothetical protein DES50_11471 [Williamsia faeni]
MKRIPVATHGIYRDSYDSVPVRRTYRDRLPGWHRRHFLERIDTSLGPCEQGLSHLAFREAPEAIAELISSPPPIQMDTV